MSIDRRSFIKLSGAAAGIATLPLPLLAKKHKNSKEMDALLDYQPGERTTNVCEMCFWGCGVDVYTKDGIVHTLEGNKHNPNNYGTLCAKGNAGTGLLYDPDRLKYPLIRVGERGEGKWRKATWDEAFEYIYDKLNPLIEEYGPQTIAAFSHGSSAGDFNDMIKILGSPNLTVASFSECRGSREIGYSLTFGGGGIGGHERYDMKNAKYMLIFGRNMSGAIQVREARDFIEGISRGCKLTYVDPRLSESAAVAHRWLQIKPGCDLALALAIIHVIMRDNLANMDYVQQYCYGYNELKDHVKQYTPEWAEKECGISAKEIEEVAWELAKAAPNCIVISPRRNARYANDSQSARAMAIINALMGSYGSVGGIWENTKFPISMPPGEPIKPVTTPRADGAGTTYPHSPTNLGLTNGVYKATLESKPYPIKAWLLYCTNPISHTSTQTGRLFDAMKNVDLIVSIDVLMNDSAYYADVVLPESTYLERSDGPFFQGDEKPFLTFREAAVKPMYDTKPIREICYGIMSKFGYTEYFNSTFEQDMAILKSRLTKDQYDTLMRNGVLVYEDTVPFPYSSGKKMYFPTPTGKIQLYAPQAEEMYEKYGDVCAPMPTYVPVKQPKDGEYRLIFGRGPAHAHARTQNNWMLMELEDDSPVWINPKDAKNLGLKDSDKIILTNIDTGYKSQPQAIKITDRIIEKTMFIHHGFGHISKDMTIAYNKGISDAFFCSNDIDPLSGCSGHNNGFVAVVKA